MEHKNENFKYVAIKPKGLSHYIWFEQKKRNSELGCFFGDGGWGKDGVLTNINCRLEEIDGFIYSDTIQYLK